MQHRPVSCRCISRGLDISWAPTRRRPKRRCVRPKKSSVGAWAICVRRSGLDVTFSAEGDFDAVGTAVGGTLHDDDSHDVGAGCCRNGDSGFGRCSSRPATGSTFKDRAPDAHRSTHIHHRCCARRAVPGRLCERPRHDRTGHGRAGRAAAAERVVVARWELCSCRRRSRGDEPQDLRPGFCCALWHLGSQRFQPGRGVGALVLRQRDGARSTSP